MNTDTAIWSNDWDQAVPLDTPKAKRAWRLRVFPVAEDLLSWENLDLIEETETDSAVNPGQAISIASMDRERTRRTLSNMIRQFVLDGFSWPTGGPVRVSPITAKAANRLLALLPDDIMLPKVAPDEEGELIFAWESEGRTDLVVVDGWQLHIVVKAGTREARYYDDIQFTGEIIPAAVIEAFAG